MLAMNLLAVSMTGYAEKIEIKKMAKEGNKQALTVLA